MLFSPDALAAVRDLRARGTDRDGNTEVVLDGTGRLVGFTLTDLGLVGGRFAVERRVRSAFDAACADLEARRVAAAADLAAAGRARLSALTDDLQRLSDHADARLQAALEEIGDRAARVRGAR